MNQVFKSRISCFFIIITSHIIVLGTTPRDV
jgi:hypothetical protein